MNEIKVISPSTAWKMLQEIPQAVLIDVRASMEYLFVGHPKGAISVPWIDEPDWKVDPHFVTHVRQLLLGGAYTSDESAPAPVMLICRSGKRSMEAGKRLIEDGFKDVYNVEHGFEGPLDESHHRSALGGWRFEGLPWEQS